MEHKSDTTELQRTSGQEFVDIKDVVLLDGIFKESQQAGCLRAKRNDGLLAGRLRNRGRVFWL